MTTRPDLVRVKLENGAEATVGASLAKSAGLKPLDKPATDALGTPLATKYPAELKGDGGGADGVLRGKALDKALTAAELSTAGTAAEKRQRLADHQTSGDTAPGDTNTGGEPAPSEEDSK